MEDQRTKFEAWATEHFAQFDQQPNLGRATKQPHNYHDIMVNAMWWGWQAGQDAMSRPGTAAAGRKPTAAERRAPMVERAYGAKEK